MRPEEIAEWYRKHVLVYRITGWAHRTLCHIPVFRKLPRPHMAEVPHWFAVVVSLMLTIITETLILLSGSAAALGEAFFVVIALGIVFFLTLRQAEMVGRRVVDAFLVKMSPPLTDLQIWTAISKNIKGQFLVAAAVTLVCIPLEIAYLRQVLAHTSSTWPIIAFASAEAWVLTSSAYMGVVSSRNFVGLLKSLDLNLYPFDPARSPTLIPITSLFAEVMFDQAILGVAIVMLFFVVKPTTFTATIGTAILIFIVLMLIGNFVYAQLKLAALISQVKYKTISELQERIKQIYECSIVSSSEDNQAKGNSGRDKELSQLLNLYEKVIRSSRFAIDIESVSTYLAGLVWPLVSILTVNLPVPRELIENISQILGTLAQVIAQSMYLAF